MADDDQKQETGGALMFAGLAVWVAGLLVLFFLPAGLRLGHQGVFGIILLALGVLGTVLMGWGWSMRKRGDE